MSAIARCLDSCTNAVGRVSKRTCPAVRKFLRSSPEEYRVLKAVFGLPIGLGLGIGFYYAVIVRLRLPEYLEYALTSFFLAGLSLGFAKSVQVRCIAMLTFPTFFGKSGRSYVASFAIVYLVVGPIGNIMLNAKEVTRSISCSVQLTSNQTAAKWELRLQPILDVMKDLQAQAMKVDNITKDVRKEFIPVEKEVEDDREVNDMKADTDYVDDLTKTKTSRTKMLEERHRKRKSHSKGQESENKYSRKLDYRCEDVFSLGVLHCRKTFKKTEEKCMKKLSVAGYLLCLPLKLTIMCELVRFLPGITGANCDSMGAVNQGFGEGFQAADDASKAMDSNFDVRMQYKVVAGEQPLEMRTSEDVSKEVAHEFSQRQMWFDFCMTLLQRFTAFLFLRVFVSSNKYHRKYLSDFKFDNMYMTGYFRRIDARRHKQGKRTLLPLKKTEKKVVIEPTKMGLMGPEKKKLVSGTMRIIMRLVICGFIILIDRIIYEVLDIISRHSRIDYKQTGTHHIALNIEGEGVVAHLVRTLLRGFHKKHQIHNLTSNRKCLPRPVLVPNSYIWKIFAVYGAVWGLMIFEAFGLRLRRAIASFFYRKREKKRVLYMYNDMLKKRKGFLRHMRHDIRRKVKEHRLSKKVSVLVACRFQFPRLCACLGRFAAGKKRCLICDEPENKKSYHCRTEGCNFMYCAECWVDVRRRCYACTEKNPDSTSESELTDLDLDT